MTIWTDRIEEHPLGPLLDELMGFLLRDASRTSVGALEYFSRFRNAVHAVLTALRAADPELVTSAMLDSVTEPAQLLANELREFAADGNTARLSTADSYAESLLAHSGGLRLAAVGEDAVADVQSAVTNFRRSAAQLLHGVEEQAGAAAARLDELSAQITVQAEEISKQRALLQSAITEYQRLYSDTEGQRTQTFHQTVAEARASLDAIANEGKGKLDAAAEEARATTEQFVEAGQQALSAQLDAARDAAAERMSELDDLRNQAVRAVSVIGNTGLTGDYQRVANAEAKAADRWRWIAIGSFALAALGNAAVLGFELNQHLSVTTLIAARLSISIPLLALATYAIAESHENRKEERANRSFELQLASIGPYLAELPSETQQTIRDRVFDRFFPGRAAPELPGVGE